MNFRTVNRCAVIAALLGLTLLALAALPADAQSAVDPVDALPVAGNYCVSCHASGDARLERASEWAGSPATTPRTCPGLRLVAEQTYYVERQLLANARLGDAAATSLDERYAHLLDLPLSSAEAFEAEAQSISYAGGKTYTALNAVVDRGKRIRVLIAAAVVTAFLLFAFAWGLRNTFRAQPAKLSSMWRPGWRTVVVLAFVLALFALPLFRFPPAAVATSTDEDQAAQAELETSSRAGAVAERSIARAAMVGEIAATWATIDRARAGELLAEALAAERAARDEADALWGRAEAAREAGVGSPAMRDKATLVAAELLAVRGRAWGLRLIAESWSAVDREESAAILAEAEAVARANPTIYGELDLRAIAAAWTALDPAHAVELPPGPAWPAAVPAEAAEAEALAFYRAGDLERAWDAAARIPDEWDRARAQSSVAAAWGNAAAAREIAVPALRDRALRLVAVSAGDAALASEIASPYERVTALASLGQGAQAAAEAAALSQKFPLVRVIAALAPTDPEQALALVEQLARESDKAEALRNLAAARGSQEVFDRALAMAAAGRIRGDALAPARASLALARDFVGKPGGAANAAAALAQAYELASKVSVKYK